MIPRAYITEWRAVAPWIADSQVEQDLVISRALVTMFGASEVAERLAVRGGAALNKLHFRPPARYSEDIDLVQVRQEPIGETLDLVRGTLDSWLGAARHTLRRRSASLVYRFNSEDDPPVNMRLKIEINTREHFTVLGLTKRPLPIASRWFSGKAGVTTFKIDELMGTKLRALYQRNKGRDLFDLWLALTQRLVNTETLIDCFKRYLSQGGNTVTREQFDRNLLEKAHSREFREDITPLLNPISSRDFAFDDALDLVRDQLIAMLPGRPWKGVGR